MGEVGNIWIKIGAKIDDFERNMSAAEKAMVKVGDKFQDIGKTLSIAGAAITASMGLIIAKTANLGDKFYDLSQRTGIAVETLSSFKLAADKSGTSIEGFATGMKGLSRVMFEAASGGKEAKEAFIAVGVSATDDVGKLRPLDQVMLDVADRFASMADGAEKNALAMKLFGKSGMDLIPMLNLGRKGLQENIDKMQKFGAVTLEEARAGDAFNDAMTELQAATGGLTRTIGNALIPTLTDLATKIAGAIAKVKDWAKEHPGLVSGLSKVALGVGAFLSILGPTIIGLATILKNIVPLKAALGLLQGGFAALISPVGLATAGIVALLIAIAPGDTIVEKFGAILEATTQTIKAWIQAVREANEIISGSWFAKSFKMEIAAQMAEAKTKAVEFAASLQVLKPSMDAIQQTMEQGPKVWNEWSTSVKATDAILAANKETIVKWIDQALVWLGLTKDMSGGASVLGDMLKALGLKTKTELTAELANAEAALKLLKTSAEATPGAIKALEDKIKTLKESIYGARTETETLTETFTPMAKGAEFVRDVMQEFTGELTNSFMPAARDMTLVMAAAPGVFDKTGDAASGLKLVFKAIGDAMGVSADTIAIELYNIRVAFLRTINIMLPYIDLLPPAVKSATKTMGEYFAGLYNDIAIGLGDAIQGFLTGWSDAEKKAIQGIRDAMWSLKSEYEKAQADLDKLYADGLISQEDYQAKSKLLLGDYNKAYKKLCDDMGEYTTGFGELFEDVWESIKKAFFRILGEMLAQWILIDLFGTILVSLGILKKVVDEDTGAIELAFTDSFKAIALAAADLVISLGFVATAILAILGALGLLGDSFPYIPGSTTAHVPPGSTEEERRPPDREYERSQGRRGLATGGIAWAPQLVRVAEREPEIIMPLRKFRGAQNPADTGKYPRGGEPSGPVNLTFNIKALDGADMINVVHNKIKPILQNILNHNGLRVPAGAVGGA